MKRWLPANITFFIILILFSIQLSAQQCVKDSNYYSLTYRGQDKNFVRGAVLQGGVVALSRHSVFSDFITRFTPQGSVIFSSEYQPDYPFNYWWQYPWYNNTLMQGIAAGRDSTCFVYGTTTEHGKSINNGEDPPAHQAGLIMQLDKFGNVLSGKYLGNWRTDYSINSLIQLPDGRLVIYLCSHFFPFVSKIICMDEAGNISWGTPLQVNRLLYSEVSEISAVIKQRSNGNIVVANIMLRNIDDTLQYPFTPPIILPAPLYYFHLFEIDHQTGKVLWEGSYQCPPLKNTNAPAGFIPTIKNITELPNHQLSISADMYIPADNEIFYKHRLFSRSAVNFITNPEGNFIKLLTYHPENGAASLESVQSRGNTGEQLFLLRDIASGRMILSGIDTAGQLEWSKAFAMAGASPTSTGVAVEAQGNKGFFIFQSDPGSVDFHLSITNALGNNPCTQSPVDTKAEEIPWPWYVDKIHFFSPSLDIDFRYSPFNFVRKPHSLTENTDCEYLTTCCRDVIDSIHPHAVLLCKNETYTLPDQTVVSKPGNYYSTLKTIQGCDSILYYNVKVLKSPSELSTSPDTCLNTAAVILLRASDGYDTYWWNNTRSDSAVYAVRVPGMYTVSVENKCGRKTDTVTVFDHCDFPIYFPNAFTPNGDLFNDILRVPPSNRNKLRYLRIFNRWGQLVFSTTQQAEGWDGRVRGVPLPAGTYIYYLEMESLDGKKLDQKGTVILIR